MAGTFQAGAERAGPFGAHRAPMGDRALAFLIDRVAIGFGVLVYAVPANSFYNRRATYEPGLCTDFDGRAHLCDVQTDGTFLLALALWVVGFGVYVVLGFLVDIRPLATTGQSPGRRVMKLKVVRVADGSLLSLPASLGRWAASRFLSRMFFGIGYWLAFFGPDRQTLHDALMKSVVVPANIRLWDDQPPPPADDDRVPRPEVPPPPSPSSSPPPPPAPLAGPDH